MFFSWRRKTQPCSLSASRCHRPFRVRPTLEWLEERDLLVATPLLVTSNADSGPGTLREAITTANSQAGPTTIDFAIILGGPTIALLSPLPLITATGILD